MLAIHARYRGRAKRRAELVRRSAEALATLDGVDAFEILGVEDIRTTIRTPEALCDVVMALLADGEWAIGVGVSGEGEPSGSQGAVVAATAAIGDRGRAGVVKASVVAAPRTAGENIAATFTLLGQVLSKRTSEGREATALVRRGLTQNEAAEQLGISKQAMSQRLQAAGWQAEAAGWQLAVNLVRQAEQEA